MIFTRFSAFGNAKNFDKYSLLSYNYFLPVHNIDTWSIEVGCACTIYAIDDAMSGCGSAGNGVDTSGAQTEIF